MRLQGRKLRPDLEGDDVRLLHRELAQLGIEVPPPERDRAQFGEGTAAAVARFQSDRGLPATGVVDERTAILINLAVDASGGRGDQPPADGDRPSEGAYAVNGTVTSPERGGVSGQRVQIVDRNVQSDRVLAEATTDARGRYSGQFDESAFTSSGKQRPDLQARVLGTDGVIGRSDVHYEARHEETLDVRLAAGAAQLPGEHEALVQALATHFDGDLGALKEDDERSDLSYLAHKTGWDARAVALASLSQRFSDQAAQAGAEGLSPSHYYALFRAGVPANPDAVYRLDPQVASEIWRTASAAGVVDAAVGTSSDAAAARFERLSAEQTLVSAAVPGAATLGALLSVSLGDDARLQRRFAELLVANRSQPARMWEALEGELGTELTQRLRVDGQLAALTIDNATVIGRLRAADGGSLSAAADLAGLGYHRPERWDALLDGAVPEQIPGDDDAAKRANYAELLAAQVRLSFPTAVVAELVAAGELKLGDDGNVQREVHRFLVEHQNDFEIGMHPTDRYLAKAGIRLEEPVREQIKRLQRVYQITPDDRAMRALLDRGLDSATQVVQYSRDEFTRLVSEEIGGTDVAHLTYAKAQQVHVAVLNVASSYLTTRAAPALGGDLSARIVDPPAQLDALAAAGPQPGSPTMETLFGSLDFCGCEHCRSVLSPAAYLVDLLLFCDRKGNAAENPQDVLLELRPDLQHVLLTCENTNTPLPYIDIVNETLEHFVVNSLSLAGFSGHDTDPDVTPEELLARPQYVEEQAYEALKSERFPPPLPFHRDLELMRRHFDALEVPLDLAIERLRVDDAIERTPASGYGWRDILVERLRLSRAEHDLLTDGSLALADLYGFPAGTAPATVLDQLANAKAFSRRAGLSYDELVELIQTRFVNPGAWLLPKLERLGVSFATLDHVKDGSLSDADLEKLLPAKVTAADVHAFVSGPFGRAAQLILLTQIDAAADPCSMDSYRLLHADPDPAASPLRASECVRLARFVRLWRKLGWTIEETDQAIAALYPEANLPGGADETADLAGLDTGFEVLIMRLGVVLEVMDRLRVKRRELPELLSLWAPIGTAGSRSLYRRLFLGAAFVAQDPAFAENVDGDVLRDPNATLGQHAEALRAATGLTGDGLALIQATIPGGANAPLTLENVSELYRHAWLARRLRLSVAELLAMLRHTGLDAFAAPDPPNPPLVALLDLLNGLRESSVKPGQALFLLYNEDVTGVSAQDEEQLHSFARTLRTGFQDVEAQFAIVDDPRGEIARARMTLVYGTAAADFFFGLVGGTFVVSTPYAHSGETLETAVVAAGGGRLAYDDLRKQLSYAGVLGPTDRQALDLVPGVSQAFKDAVAALETASKDQTDGFFARYPELLAPYVAYASSSAPDAVRRAAALSGFLPQLVQRRKRQQALATLAGLLKVDPLLAEAIADEVSVLHADGDPSRSALDDLAALETGGLSGQLFWRDTATGSVDSASPPSPGGLDLGPAPATPLPANPMPGGAVSGIWSGYLEAPESAAYALAVDTGAARVELAIDGTPVPLARDGSRWRTQAPLAFVAGQLAVITLTAEAIADRLTLRWESTGHGWEVVPSRRLFGSTAIEHLRASYARILKAASLATAMKLTAGELEHLAGDADLRVAGAGWLNALRGSGQPDAATATALTTALKRALDFRRLKAALSPDDERLLGVLVDPLALGPDATSALLTLTGWERASLDALLLRFAITQADLAGIAAFARVYDAYALLTTLGTPAAAAIAAATNDPTPATVAAFESALRARYEEADWLTVLQPINDELRGLQRDALVAYILRRLSESPATAAIDTADKLFEYFLMDVQMAPCMQTSRIRHALSSVQLFIERCMMNLERRVAPSSVDAGQWEWMKRYRVWEANRKVFLWPENWLEPELRDDQSPFFKEVMSELLQGDITEDRAATALLTYLSKLEEVARLDPCGVHLDEHGSGKHDDVLHVVARTAGANRKYYYRRREYGYWTPWEHIKLDIEDNPVVPVVWKGRVFVFWLRLIKKTPVDAAAVPATSKASGGLGNVTLSALKADIAGDARSTAMMSVTAVLCYSELVDGKWQPVKTSSPDRPAVLGQFPIAGPGAFDRSALTLEVFGSTGDLLVSTYGSGVGSFWLYNTHSAPEVADVIFDFVVEATRGISTAGDTLSVSYHAGWFSGTKSFERDVVDGTLAMKAIKPEQRLADPWTAPFFMSDARHAFYVSTTQRTVSVAEFVGFGIGDPPHPVAHIPPIIWEEDPRLKARPHIWEDVFKGGSGVIQPGPIERGISQDAFINTALSSGVAVPFGDVLIGPAGQIDQRSTQR